MDIEHVQCIIIGSGPAGYTAAIYVGRANIKAVLYEGIMPGGQLSTATMVENFPGYPEGVTGLKLMRDLREQAKRFGTDIRTGIVTKVDFDKKPYLITIDSNTIITSDAVIIATGTSLKQLGVEGEKKYLGEELNRSATCNGILYQNKVVAVIGNSDMACKDAIYLSDIAQKVYLVVKETSLEASQNVQKRLSQQNNIIILYEHEVIGLYGEDKLKGIHVIRNKGKVNEDQCNIDIDGLFLATGRNPNSEIFRSWLKTDEKGYILTEGYSPCTNIKGVFAAGSVADTSYNQAITAAASGCKAALEVERYLIQEGLRKY